MPELATDFSKLASYRIQDPVGPGCGWDWSAQKPLKYDDADLNSAKEEILVSTQNDVNAQAQSYVDSQLSWARIVTFLMPQLDNWNIYTKKVNSIHAKWDKLVADREAFRPIWNDYLAKHEEWSTFDARKAEAEKNYNDALRLCKADRKDHENWVREWGEEAMKKKMREWEDAQREREERENSGEETPPAVDEKPKEELPKPVAPPEPENCLTDPPKPAILSESRPAKPEAPALPKDVTIPNSWPKVS